MKALLSRHSQRRLPETSNRQLSFDCDPDHAGIAKQQLELNNQHSCKRKILARQGSIEVVERECGGDVSLLQRVLISARRRICCRRRHILELKLVSSAYVRLPAS